MSMRLLAAATLMFVATTCGGITTESDLPPWLDAAIVNGVSYYARAELRPAPGGADLAIVTVTARNDNPNQVDFQYGGCFMRLLVYDNAGGSGSPVWDSAQQDDVCLAIGYRVSLAQGESKELEGGTVVSEILGTRLPARRYFFNVILETSIATVALKAGGLELSR